MIDHKNLFKEAVLIQLSATCWQTDKKLPSAMLEEVGNTDFLRGRKLLLPKDATEMIKQVIGKARHYLRKIALPFPIKGCMLVPKKLIPVIQEHLSQLKWEYDTAVDDFLYHYRQTVLDAKESLGELYDELDYPSREEVRKRFRFEWRHIVVGPSNSKVLPPSLYQEEVQKFQNLMEQARQEAISALRVEFVNLVANLNDKLKGTNDGDRPKKLRDAAVENLKAFLDNFANRNLFEDETLSELVEQCRSIIGGTTASQIRTNSQVKENLHNQMEQILETVENSLEDLPRRKLRFAA